MGHLVSKESKEKMSNSKKGCVGPNKGRKMLDEVKNKISASKKGRSPWNKGLKSSGGKISNNNKIK